MEAAKERSARPATCLSGPAQSPTGNGSMASGTQGDGLRSGAPSQLSSVAEVLKTLVPGLPRGTEGGLRSLGKYRELLGDRSKSNSKAKVKGGWLVIGTQPQVAPGSKAADANTMLPKTYSTQILRGTSRAYAQESELQPQTANNWNHLMPTQWELAK